MRIYFSWDDCFPVISYDLEGEKAQTILSLRKWQNMTPLVMRIQV